VEDQPADTGDLTTDATEPTPDDDVEAPAAETVQTADATAGDESDDDVADSVETAPAPVTPPRKPTRAHRMPLGKARRAAPAATEVEAVAEAPPEAETETPAGEADDTPAAEADAAESESSQSESAESESAEFESEAAESNAEHAESTEDEPILVPHRPAGRRLKIAAVAAAVLFIAAATFAGAMVQPLLADRAAVQTKVDVARTAANAITTLWTYTPDNMDSLADRAAKYLTGDFESQYRKYVDALAPTNKQAQVSNNTQVLGAAVESLTPSEATAVVYTNSTSTSPVTKNIPSLKYLSYRLTMERRDADWLITRMTLITSLDLTPQL
jgi:Mce-associated membrane protein